MEICLIVLPYNVGLFSLSPLHHSMRKKNITCTTGIIKVHIFQVNKGWCEADVQEGPDLQAKKREQDSINNPKGPIGLKFHNQEIYLYLGIWVRYI